jgi:hypothetical protein
MRSALPTILAAISMVVSACHDQPRRATAAPSALPVPSGAIPGQTATVAGVVRDSSGEPVSNAGIRVISFSARQHSQTDSSGNYRLVVPVNIGSVHIGAWKQGYAQQCAVEATPAGNPHVEVTLTLHDRIEISGLPAVTQRRRISGTIYETGARGRRPLAGAWVGWEPVHENPAADTLADAQGRYALCGLPTGHIDGLVAIAPTENRFTYVSVQPGMDATVDIEIEGP